LLSAPARRAALPGLERGLVRDPVEPAGEPARGRDGRGLVREDEEGGLERILGVRPIAQHPQADGEDHRPVPADEEFERGLVAGGDEPGEQFGVAGGVAPQRRERHAGDDPGERSACHLLPPAGAGFGPNPVVPASVFPRGR